MLKSTSIMLMGVAMLYGCSAQSGADTAAEVSAYAQQLPDLTGDHVWAMDAAKSTLEFQANYNGEFTAGFNRFQTAIRLNPDAPENGEIYAAVDLSSLQSDNNDVKSNLPMAPWFDTKQFQSATFTSTDITSVSPGDFSAAGDLTLKGISKPATLNFTLGVTENAAIADGTLALKRLDYNVGTGSDFKDESWVKFPVSVSVHIEASR